MAYVQPNSNLQFYGDTGLTPNYDDSRYFASAAARDSYFNALTKLATAASCSYARETRGSVRVQIPMVTLYRCQYMRFQNASFENKWFYAFVTSVEYINNVTTQVNFELDVLTTWMGDFTMGQCFVERQHEATDAIGDNIVEENLDYGEYIYQNSVPTGYFNDQDEYETVVATTLNSDGATFPSAYNLFDGVYNGATLHVWNSRTTAGKQNLDAFFDAVNTNEFAENVVSVYEVPAIFFTNVESRKLQVAPLTRPTGAIDGYTPANKKLYIYPYNILRVTNCEGDSQDYRYEFFTGGSATFEVIYSLLPPAQVELVPLNYKGVAENVNETMSMNVLPTGAFVNDSYKAYLAQSKSNAISTLASGLTGAGMTAAMGNPAIAGIQAAGAIGGALSSAAAPAVDAISNTLAGRSERSGHGAQQVGTPTVNVFYANDMKDYYLNALTITGEYAQIIDNYFTVFGYAQRKVMTPNLQARPYFTYIKTIGCVIHGSIPADDAAKIEEIFNRGVRLWTSSATIGDYTVNNAPT